METNPHFTVNTLTGRYDLLALVQKHPARYPYLLESTAQSLSKTASISRYDILMALPQQQLRKTWQGELLLDNKVLSETSFLQTLNTLHQPLVSTQPFSLPFTGGWFLYLGYELASEIEPKLTLAKPEQKLPIALATRIPAAIIYDHEQDMTHVMVENSFADRLDDITDDLFAIEETMSKVSPCTIHINEDDPQRYIDNVRKVHEYIREGDVFQVNLSRRWYFDHDQRFNPFDIYRQLQKTNPAPFSGYVQIDDDLAILSSSPERLVCVHNNKVQTRPIAGTRPRGQNQQDDAQLQAELIANLKERAEHVMLIDLERNDLGRICEPGSIVVDEMMKIESYAHVHHIVSNISGRLRQKVAPGDVIAAVFPGGTITGCPKVRCMEIIQELEQTARGAYTGSIGYLNHNGDMDLNILIRSLVIDDKEGSLRAGAGLVADSIPEKELEETRSKAKGMLLALTGCNA